MIRRLAPLALALLLTVPLAAQSAPSVTLFANGRTLVRRTLSLELPKGTSTHTVVLGLFDPSTLTALDQGTMITRIGYDGASDEPSLLRRNIGREFTFPQGAGKEPIRARLVAMDPERWELLAGAGGEGVIFSRPGRLVWPPELVPEAPVADVTVRSDRTRDQLRVMYEAQGGSWRASYRLFLGKAARLEGTATIAAGTLDLADADVQLLAGDIGQRVAAAPMPMAAMARDQVMSKSMEAGMPSSESIGEVKLYTLPGTVSFTPGTMLSLPLFDPAAVSPQLKLSVGGSLPYYGGFGQQPDEQEVPVEVRYRMERKQGTPFGDLPLPAGGVSVYDLDQAGRVQLVGQGGIGHTAPGERFEVSTGTAFDVTARRTQTEFTTTRLQNPSRTVANVGYTVALTNAKDTAVTVEVREDRGGEWSVVSSSVAPVRRSSSRVVFPVTIPAKGEATLTYRLRVVW